VGGHPAVSVSRLGVAFGALFALSLLTTRFMPPAPLALSSGVAPLGRLVHQAGLNLRAAFEAVVLERGLRRENRELRERVARLEGDNRRLRDEVGRLRQVAKIRLSTSPAVVATATVISVDPSPLLSRLVVDKGAADGVQLKGAVIVPEGLVGSVLDVTRRSAVVQTLVDPGFEVSVKIDGKGGRAIARGVAGNRLRAEGFAGVKVESGDVVMSLNALGGAFPTVKVGKVVRVLPPGANSLGQTVFIEPAVDVSALDVVSVLRPL
jgi:rod shape-determining protein MreC